MFANVKQYDENQLEYVTLQVIMVVEKLLALPVTSPNPINCFTVNVNSPLFQKAKIKVELTSQQLSSKQKKECFISIQEHSKRKLCQYMALKEKLQKLSIVRK
jgi:hypothetical protein